MSSRHVWVADIPDATTEADLLSHFGRYGRVGGITFLPPKRMPDKNECTLAAFVDFDTVAAAEEAVKEKRLFRGSRLRLEYKVSSPRKKRKVHRDALHITNLPPDCTEEQVRDAFEPFGPVKTVRCFGKPSGWRRSASITFESQDSARRALHSAHGQGILSKVSIAYYVSYIDGQPSGLESSSTSSIQRGQATDAAGVRSTADYQPGQPRPPVHSRLVRLSEDAEAAPQSQQPLQDRLGPSPQPLAGQGQQLVHAAYPEPETQAAAARGHITSRLGPKWGEQSGDSANNNSGGPSPPGDAMTSRLGSRWATKKNDTSQQSSPPKKQGSPRNMSQNPTKDGAPLATQPGTNAGCIGGTALPGTSSNRVPSDVASQRISDHSLPQQNQTAKDISNQAKSAEAVVAPVGSRSMDAGSAPTSHTAPRPRWRSRSRSPVSRSTVQGSSSPVQARRDMKSSMHRNLDQETKRRSPPSTSAGATDSKLSNQSSSRRTSVTSENDSDKYVHYRDHLGSGRSTGSASPPALRRLDHRAPMETRRARPSVRDSSSVRRQPHLRPDEKTANPLPRAEERSSSVSDDPREWPPSATQNLVLRSVPSTVTEGEIMGIFKPFGAHRVRLATMPNTAPSFRVSFSSMLDAMQAAKSFHPFLKGRRVIVDFGPPDPTKFLWTSSLDDTVDTVKLIDFIQYQGCRLVHAQRWSARHAVFGFSRLEDAEAFFRKFVNASVKGDGLWIRRLALRYCDRPYVLRHPDTDRPISSRLEKDSPHRDRRLLGSYDRQAEAGVGRASEASVREDAGHHTPTFSNPSFGRSQPRSLRESVERGREESRPSSFGTASARGYDKADARGKEARPLSRPNRSRTPPPSRRPSDTSTRSHLWRPDSAVHRDLHHSRPVNGEAEHPAPPPKQVASDKSVSTPASRAVLVPSAADNPKPSEQSPAGHETDRRQRPGTVIDTACHTVSQGPAEQQKSANNADGGRQHQAHVSAAEVTTHPQAAAKTDVTSPEGLAQIAALFRLFQERANLPQDPRSKRAPQMTNRSIASTSPVSPPKPAWRGDVVFKGQTIHTQAIVIAGNKALASSCGDGQGVLRITQRMGEAPEKCHALKELLEDDTAFCLLQVSGTTPEQQSRLHELVTSYFRNKQAAGCMADSNAVRYLIVKGMFWTCVLEAAKLTPHSFNGQPGSCLVLVVPPSSFT